MNAYLRTKENIKKKYSKNKNRVKILYNSLAKKCIHVIIIESYKYHNNMLRNKYLQ